MLVLLLYGGLIGCNQSRDGEGRGDVIARYGEELLYREDMNHFLADSLQGDDSVRLARQFIQLWLKQHATSEAARQKINGIEAEIAPQLDDYKHSLIEHKYTEWLIEQNEDKFKVSEVEIENYYNKFHQNFISRSPYYQYFYLKTTREKQYQIANLMRSPDPQKIDELIEEAIEIGAEYKLDSSYVSETEIEQISEGFYFGNIRRASMTTLYPYQHQEGDTTYYDFFRMLNVVKPGELMPLSLCEERIRTIIRNQRKNALIEQNKLNLVQQAENAQKITIY